MEINSTVKGFDSGMPILKAIMKTFIFLCCTLTFAFGPNEVLSQNADITIAKEKKMNVKQAFRLINRQANYKFIYRHDLIKDAPELTFKKGLIKTRDLLNRFLTPINFTYEFTDNSTIVVKKMASAFINESNITELTDVQSQVSGAVVDSNGTPLPGANILEKGTTNGIQADFDGNFSMDIAEGSAILVVSYIGFLTKEVPVKAGTANRVVLVEDTAKLEEVVVIGYGTQRKSDLTGSVSSLSEDDFNQGVNTSVDQLISGRSAGVQVTQTSSEPGGGMSIRIRGASSINANNEPLYVVDGIPLDNSSLLSSSSSTSETQLATNPNSKNPLNSINPQDIKSIEILKDASATAIYGSRGANGVILITTKSGEEGKTRISYDFYSGVQFVAKKMDVLSTKDYIQTINGISTDAGNGIVFDQDDIVNIGAGTDWQDQIFTTASIQNHTISVSGGNEKTKFYSSFNFFDQSGVVKNTGLTRFIGRLRLDNQISDRLSFGVIINTSLVNDKNSIDGVNINDVAGPINTALLYDPTLEIRNPNGTINQSNLLTINNPVALIEGVTNKSETKRTFSNITLNYEIVENLEAKVNFGYDQQTNVRDVYNSRLTLNGERDNGVANIETLQGSNFLTEFTLNYTNNFNKDNQLTALGGITFQDFKTRVYSTTISGFPTDEVGTNNLGLGNIETVNIRSNKQNNTLLSYLGRVNYRYKNKYLLTASIRADGSSRFGENNKYGYFPSLAMGWKLEEENFIPEVFDQLKLRTSWGLTGNQGIGNYNSLSTLSLGGTSVLGGAQVVGVSPSRVANPELKWETTEQFNVGIDYSLFKSRIEGSVDYFNKKTTDLLVNIPLPLSSGFPSFLSNAGNMKNNGIEFLLTSRNIVKPNFSWTTTFNFSAIRNEVVNLGNQIDVINTGSIQGIGNTSIIQPGSSINSYYGYDVIGIFNNQDQVNQSAQPGSQPGYPIFRDVNNDGSITPDDRVVLGNPFPDFTYGLNNTLTYKDFTMDFFFQGQQGASLININSIESLYPLNFRRNRFSDQYLDRWTPTNTDAKWPSGVNPFSYGPSRVTSLVVEDASYLRLRTLQLSYNLPARYTGFFQSARIYIIGQNLLTITNYRGFDPEANSFGRSNVKIDYSTYPLASGWMIGTNLKF